MHRLLVETDLLSRVEPELSRDAMHHLKVVRIKDGEEVELFDGRGASRLYKFSVATKSLVATRDIELATKPQLAITLFACVTKGSRWDWTIEKATELGVARIVPVISERTIVRIASDEREAKRSRWQRIAEDASRQSDAKWLPEILAPVSFEESLALVRETNCFVGALTNPPAKPLLAMLENCRDKNEKPLAIYVGPEGDFTRDELATLLEIAVATNFGPTILRAETAALFAISTLAAFCHSSEDK